MQWDDIGFLLSKTKYSENSLIIEVFTENHGKCSGIVFGGTSKKIKNYLQVGNNIYINYNYKNENKLGYFKIEIVKALTPIFFSDKKKLLCINSAMNLIKLFTVEFQKNLEIYKLINEFYKILQKNNWIYNYIFWELKLLKLIGYDLELKKIVSKEIDNDEIKYFVKSRKEKKYVPTFMVDYNENEPKKESILHGLRLIGDYIEKNIFKPNNMKHPRTRIDFVNLFK